MQETIGNKECVFTKAEGVEAVVTITFPRAKIFKPQPDGTLKVFEGRRVITYSQAQLQSLIASLKNPKDLEIIAEKLKDFAKSE